MTTTASIIALVGNPNSGKTTLFNTLTGSNQQVGNWPGVTVEQKKGFYFHNHHAVSLLDLPGCYSLVASSASPLDEKITHDFLMLHKAAVIVNVVDATQLERHLYLSLQLLEQGFKMVIALNMMDEAFAAGIQIDVARLSTTLHCPVVSLSAFQAANHSNIQNLKKQIEKISRTPSHFLALPYPKIFQETLQPLPQQKPQLTLWQCIRALEGDESCITTLQAEKVEVAKLKQTIEFHTQHSVEETIAHTRVAYISAVLNACYKQTVNKRHFTEYVDAICLHRVIGVPIFFAVMYALFVFAIQGGGLLQDYLEPISEGLFINKMASLCQWLHLPHSVTHIMSQGLGQGINTTITFVPVIGCMFLFLALLESSGYMARAAFVMDRFMQWLGLPGHAFVPLIVGFGCNVPAIMGARTLSNSGERLLTILMSPFMSCGARLTIYALFVAAFFPHNGANIIFGLYLLGIIVAVLTALVLKNTVLTGTVSHLTLELPPYRFPRMASLRKQTLHRLKRFLVKAGVLIVPLCIALSAINVLDGSDSIEKVGRFITPVFEPMGIEPNNWQASMGLLSGVLAKEVVVGTLSALYAQEEDAKLFGEANVIGVISQKFQNKAAAFAYLLFILLYFPCVSVIAVINKELNFAWAAFTVLWTTGIGYTMAVSYYQIATFRAHPSQTIMWCGVLFTIWFGIGFILKAVVKMGAKKTLKPVPTRVLIVQ